VRLLWILRKAVEKAQNLFHRFAQYRRSSTPCSFPGKHSGVTESRFATAPATRFLSTARDLARVQSQRREHRSAPWLLLKLSVNQAKKLASSKHLLVDDLLSIRRPTPHGNSEFLAKIHLLRCGASTALAHCLSLLAFVVQRLWKTSAFTAGKPVLLPQEWCVPKPARPSPLPLPTSPAP